VRLFEREDEASAVAGVRLEGGGIHGDRLPARTFTESREPQRGLPRAGCGIHGLRPGRLRASASDGGSCDRRIGNSDRPHGAAQRRSLHAARGDTCAEGIRLCARVCVLGDAFAARSGPRGLPGLRAIGAGARSSSMCSGRGSRGRSSGTSWTSGTRATRSRACTCSSESAK
jgi:hypothetical protein